jgi:predicted PurR-regulated permease PerM
MTTGPSGESPPGAGVPAGSADDSAQGTSDRQTIGPPQSASERRHWVRRLAKLWGFLAFLVGIIVLFRHVALPFVFAIVVAYALAPLIDRITSRRLAGRHIPRPLAIAIVYVNVLAVVSAFLFLFVPRLAQDFSRLFRESPKFFEKVNEVYVPRAAAWAATAFGTAGEVAPDPNVPRTDANPAAHSRIAVTPKGNGELEVRLDGLELHVTELRNGGYVVAPHVPKAPEPAGERWERTLREAIADAAQSGEEHVRQLLAIGRNIVAGTVTALASFVLILMLTAFILVDTERIHGFLRSLVPPEYRGDYGKIMEAIDRGLAGVIRGQLLICLVNGVLTYVGLLIFDVKYAILLGAVAATMSLVPIFGSIMSSVPIVAIALVSTPERGVSLVNGALVLGWILLIHLIEANYLNPKIMGKAAKIHPVVVVFALIAGERTYGLVGALFAVPVASIIQTFFLYFKRRAWQTAGATTTERKTLPPP